MIGSGLLDQVVELFGGAVVELNRAVIVIGLSLKAQVEMTEVLIDLLAKAEDEVDLALMDRAAEIVDELSKGCRDMYSDKKEN